MSCEHCQIQKAIILRPKNKMKVCKECFFDLFEEEIHELITSTSMFERGSRIGIGISGGKDSTVLAYVLHKLNQKHNYGLDLVLLCVDEGISGYRDRSISSVYENQKMLGLELKLVTYKEIFGITMDEIVKKIGTKGNCTYCGILRRQSLEDAARKMNVDCIVTGHNADDLAETVLLNIFRGDISRLRRCTLSKTKEQIFTSDKKEEETILSSGGEEEIILSSGRECQIAGDKREQIFTSIDTIVEDKIEDTLAVASLDEEADSIKSRFLSLSRCKPFKYSYQKEIVMYAYFKKLPYFSTECTYAPGASRGDFRTLIKDLEKIDSGIILNLIKSGEYFLDSTLTVLKIRKCLQCSHPTSSQNQICNACGLIDKLSNMSVSPCCDTSP